jgi:hypothetical protein
MAITTMAITTLIEQLQLNEAIRAAIKETVEQFSIG